MDYVHLEHHVVVHEIGQCRLVCLDASYLGGGQEDIFRALAGEEIVDRCLIDKVKLPVGPGYYVGVALAFKFPHYGGTDHASMAGDIYFSVFLHHSMMLGACRTSVSHCLHEIRIVHNCPEIESLCKFSKLFRL